MPSHFSVKEETKSFAENDGPGESQEYISKVDNIGNSCHGPKTPESQED